LRCWALLGLAALQQPQHRVTVLRYVATFGLSYSNTLQYLASPEAVSGWAPVTAAAMSSAFAAMKIWILLACNLDNDGDPGNKKPEEAFTFERMVWNETWPHFEKIIHVSMSLSLDSASPITSVIWSSYVDLVIFVADSGSILALDTAVTHSSLLERLSAATPSDGTNQKLTRAIHAIQYPPPKASRSHLIERARSDLLAAEKLAQRLQMQDSKQHIMDRKRDPRSTENRST